MLFHIRATAIFPLVGFVVACAAVMGRAQQCPAESPVWRAGFAKVDVTPTEPVRMSGYGSRDHPSEGVDTKLSVRAMALEHRPDNEDSVDEDAKPILLLTIDNIGFPGSLSDELAASIKQTHGLSRDRIVFSCTHTHSGPDLNRQLSNIFSTPLSSAEREAADRYRGFLKKSLLKCADDALKEMCPVKLSHGVGEAGFAANRRVLKDGRWVGFGVQADAPVDHSVPVLRISDSEDDSVLGIVFNYACHCTTVGGDYYQINADWAGLAATQLEATFPNSVALCTIGCGADANPNPRGTADLCRMHGETLANEVERLVRSELDAIDQPVQTAFDYAALSFELPTREELQMRLEEARPQTRRHAERMLRIYQEKGRLPATYPVPIQAWRFGSQLTMVFLGGEVVVDYAIRLRKVLGDEELWVTAYANDVMGYIASERMRSEGGYEFDRSGIYYGLPGPWASGSEDLLVERVAELVRRGGRAKPLPPDAALKSIEVSDPFEVQLVAHEPLVKDPINLAFADDGSLWVVEMGGYPETEPDGRVKVLRDRDGDGKFDEAAVFLDGLSFPTGVQPYRDGALISAAPEILFARDRDGDGKADQTEALYTGFKLANPQHRVSGFTYGLDHTWHLASGDTLGDITSRKTGETLNASGHDVQIAPGSGAMFLTSGRSQFIRSRDDWGRWFGNNNSRPMFHFPIDDADLKRNPHAQYTSNRQPLFDPPVAPPVFPRTSSVERFNDLFAADRFTSACSSIVARSPEFDVESRRSLMICEPVHNLVHRSLLVPNGVSFRAQRVAAEMNREFLASTDPWFRPVRAAIGPDGMLWVVDMYREVIEHPEWIPEAWQQRLDVRAGEDRGRIYRIVPRGQRRSVLPRLSDMSVDDLLALLESPVGPLRDLAQQRLIEDFGEATVPELIKALQQDGPPHAKAHLIFILQHIDALTEAMLVEALGEHHDGLRLVAIQATRKELAKRQAKGDSSLSQVKAELAKLVREDRLVVAMQAGLALGDFDDPVAARGLAALAVRPDLDRWTATAVLSSCANHATVVSYAILNAVRLGGCDLDEVRLELLQSLIRSSERSGKSVQHLVEDALTLDELSLETRLRLAECALSSKAAGAKNTNGPLAKLREQATDLVNDPQQPDSIRCRAVRLVSLADPQDTSKLDFLESLVAPTTPTSVQCEAISRLARVDEERLTERLLSRWESLSTSVRNHLIGEILSRRSTTLRLLDALETKQISVNEIPLVFREQLLKTGTRSMRVRSQRLLSRATSTPRDQLVRTYLDAMENLPVDENSRPQSTAKIGATLFKKHCVTCHAEKSHAEKSHAADGNSESHAVDALGPSLANLSNRSRQALAESILDPNRAVEPKYQSFLVQTVDGRLLTGVIAAEVAGNLTIGHADGKRSTVPRDSIEAMKSSGVSLMPEGFEKNLSPAELLAVIRYVQTM